jgi:hypothetical protein
MFKFVLAILCVVLSHAVPLADAIRPVESGPRLVSFLSNPTQRGRTGQVVADIGDGSDPQSPFESERRTDYAAHLRAAFPGGARQALVTREDAMGAADDIDQLRAALYAMVAETQNASAPRYITWLKAIAALADNREAIAALAHKGVN